jgi:hypothetical protein
MRVVAPRTYQAEDFGVVGLRLGFAATFYLADTTSNAIRSRIAEMFEDLRAELATDLRWARRSKSLKWAQARRASAVTEWLPKWDPQQSWELNFHSGEDPRDASDTSFSGYGEYAWQGGRGYVQYVLPAAEGLDQPDSACERVLAWAKTLHPEHGWAGLFICESPEVEFRQAFQPTVWQLLQTNCGLMTDDPAAHVDLLRARVLGGSWLTILSEPLVERCPGLSDLGGDVRRLGYAGGEVVRAGPAPLLGEPMGTSRPEAYEQVAVALYPIRVHDHPGLHFQGPDRMHAKQTQRWLARFDPDSSPMSTTRRSRPADVE